MYTGIKLTSQLIDQLVDGYKSGKTTPQLAEEFGITKATVCRGLRKGGIEPVRTDTWFKTKSFSEEQVKSIVQDFSNGTAIKDLKSKYNISYTSLTNLLEKAGVYKPKNLSSTDPSTRHILSGNEQQELCEKFQDGPLDRKDLAKEYNISIDMVNIILRRNNITIKKYLSEDIVDSFCDDFANGIYKIPDIARIYKLDPSLVKYWLTRRELLGNMDVEEPSGKIVSSAEFKRLAKETRPDNINILIEIRDKVSTSDNNRLRAIQLLNEIAKGDDDDNATLNNAQKLAGMVDFTKMFGKKE